MTRRSLCLAALLLAGAEGFSRSAEPEVRSTRVLLIVHQDCNRCEEELSRLRKAGGEFEAMRSRGWKIGEGPENHVQIIDREAVPEIIEKLAVQEYPALACVEGGEIIRSFKEGCTTPLDAWTFGFLLKGQNERPQGSVLEKARVQTTGQYPLRGNHWSVEGDANPSVAKLVGHLRGPNHGHQIAGKYTIETWSYEELRSLHDDLHEREMANGAAPAFAGSSANNSSSYQFRADRKVLGR
jgi:hypothetical protein